MAVQAQLYSTDHYQNINTNNNANNNMGFSYLNQDLVFMSGSSVFGFGDEHQQDQRFLDSQRIMNSSYDYQNLVSSSNSRRHGMNGFQNLGSELERQRLEMDCFLHFQNYESKMKMIIDAKDEALNIATIRTTELQNYLSMAEKEAKNWEKKAMETEAMVTELNRKLNQARARRHEDAESVCNGGDDDDDEKERFKMKMKMCL
ncbi:hypothetical protein E3N88_37961 [Mikania micrantha]|uniref:Uncharacterized protein n=1 Tax=Mikania micrantha TaxID=192012 RepID=A0A5N6LSL3_9ASTR|nr:hypothetical protein E3N88_37961 [Mikania micrantha]